LYYGGGGVIIYNTEKKEDTMMYVFAATLAIGGAWAWFTGDMVLPLFLALGLGFGWIAEEWGC
jgi:hypothetical protein